MSSRMMTFSLASLIIMFALVAIPVVAHDLDTATDGLQHVASGGETLDAAAHSAQHMTAPTVTSIELVNLMVGTMPTARDGSVVLVEDADADPIAIRALTADSGDGEFQIKVTFSGPVYNAIAAGTAAAAGDLAAADLAVTAASQATPGTNLFAAGVSITDVARMADDAMTMDVDESLNTFIITATVTAAIIGDSDADPVEPGSLPVDVWVTVNADVLFNRTGLVNGTNTFGTGNTASSRAKFTIVKMLEERVPPTVMITAPDATVDAMFTATLTFSEAVSALAMTDIMVTGGVAGMPAMGTPADGTVWTVEITPVLGATEVTVDVVDTVGTGDAVMVTAVSPPTVMVTVDTTATVDAPFMVTLTFSEEVALAMADIDVTNGVAGEPMPATTDATMDTMWTVEITPTVDATRVEVGVMAAKATGTAQTVTATTPEGAPMLAAGDYLVVIRDGASPPFGNLSPDTVEWSEVSDEDEMPDLQRLFDIGGTIQLKVEGATRLQVVFSEVMWAVDEGQVDDRAAYLGEQWIELHNRTSGDNAKDFAISDIKISTKERREALPEETDRVSNVVAGGKDWVLDKGQNGNSSTGDNMKEFISMYRNNEGEPGHQDNRWTKSTELYATNHRGTPGQKERAGVQVIGATNANRGPVIFNEISNNAEAKYEWIELRNVSGGEQNLKNWEITILTSKGDPPQDGHNAKELIQFPNADRKVPAGGILLVLATDPRDDDDHPIQTGWDITKGAGDQINGVNSDSPRYIVLEFKDGGMPDDGNFVLVLRNRGDRTSSNNDNNTRDVAGYVPKDALKVDNDKLFTNLWPLANFPEPKFNLNQLKAGEVHRRQHAGIDGTKSTNDKNEGNKTAFANVGWTGIGYRRNADANNQNGGTPGYPNGALQSNETQASADLVIITEVMYATGERANIPQWIELYNTSKTVGINLDGWRVTIVNHDRDMGGETYAGDLDKNYDISGKIPPGQTFLLVAYPGRNESKLPDERIKTLRSKRGELIMSRYGFEITLLTKGKDNKDANRKVADKVGNLATVAAADARVRRNPQSYEDPVWMLPMGTNDDGDRISIVRASMKNGNPVDGQAEAAWISFDMSGQFAATLDTTSYGHATDISSPGHTVGGVLPVSLSKFRPERMKDTGQIVIRWITESELNNAGFNILRSETRDGEFTKINTKLIAGQGTTTERTAYEYADTSAKPNVVYYYQIQDVSFDGQVTTLRTTHLRGNVTAVGKATTTWGDIKALQ